MAKKAAAKAAGGGGSPVLLACLIGIMLIMLSFVALPSVMILICGMLPTIILFFTAPRRASGALATMFSLNLAGVLPVLGILWARGHSVPTASIMLADPFMWALMLGGAGLAMFLMWFMPHVAATVLGVRYRHELAVLEKRKAALVAEWGNRVIEEPRRQ
ncbi:hypothetical protein [Oceanibacterium hippocampi]|uniref:Uncharacterized protein n=1 Tax=Oceanibacterium hippocampi TaxID=745714 RepID=A0A1Y5TVK2_9PROT|nr:hypothetical protein [Oceanibacterium hippocampi]SLN73096.1 hypothetical protein OCH7691_03568 [Oceanibacterium hippocampi]